MNIGTLLPCNVVVYRDDDDKTAVMVMDPIAALITKPPARLPRKTSVVLPYP